MAVYMAYFMAYNIVSHGTAMAYYIVSHKVSHVHSHGLLCCKP